MSDYELRRRQATLVDHILIEQRWCVYCGAEVLPRLFSTGRTKHLDHFVPVEILIRRRASGASVPNFLLPCCPRCNGFCGQLFFTSFADKFAYAAWRNNKGWRFSDNPQREQLAAMRAPDALLRTIRPIEEWCAACGYVIICPRRGGTTGEHWETSQRAEKVLLTQCTPTIRCSASSRMAS